MPFLGLTKVKGQNMSEVETLNLMLLGMLQAKITPFKIFELWFGDFKLVHITDKQAFFKTPSALRKNIILNKYIKILEECLFELIGFTVEIVIESPPEGEANFKINDDIGDYAPAVEDSREEILSKEKEMEEFLEDSDGSKSLLSEYTFDNFIVGSSNKFAKAACEAVAKEPTCYNPLFIYGQSGLGKTHLLYAVINQLKENNWGLKIVYRKCESFMNELIEAISKATTHEFKEKYRKADVLLIDDIQFIAGKVSTQEEFFHTFSALYESEKQIILTSDRPPKEIKPLEDRLRSRFEGGLIADVQPPSFELRTAIIKKKASALGLLISNEMVDYMAERLRQNIRQIEGVIKRLYALYNFSSTPVSKESIDQAIAVIDPGNIPTDAMVERIISTVSKNYGVAVEDIKSKKKTDNIANARHIAIYLIRNITDLSLKEIGKIFDRDHSTVLSSLNKVELNIKTMKNTASEIKKLKKEISEL